MAMGARFEGDSTSESGSNEVVTSLIGTGFQIPLIKSLPPVPPLTPPLAHFERIFASAPQISTVCGAARFWSRS